MRTSTSAPEQNVFFLQNKSIDAVIVSIVIQKRAESHTNLTLIPSDLRSSSAAPRLIKTTKPHGSLVRGWNFNVKEVTGSDCVSVGDQGENLTVMRSCWKLRAAETRTSD